MNHQNPNKQLLKLNRIFKCRSQPRKYCSLCRILIFQLGFFSAGSNVISVISKFVSFLCLLFKKVGYLSSQINTIQRIFKAILLFNFHA